MLDDNYATDEEINQRLQHVQLQADMQKKMLDNEVQATIFEVECGVAEFQSLDQLDQQLEILPLRKEWDMLKERNKGKEDRLRSLMDAYESLCKVQENKEAKEKQSISLLNSVYWTYSSVYEPAAFLSDRLEELKQNLVENRESYQEAKLNTEKLDQMLRKEKTALLVMQERVGEIKILHKRITKKVESVQAAKLQANNCLTIMQNETTRMRKQIQLQYTEFVDKYKQKHDYKEQLSKRLQEDIEQVSKLRIKRKDMEAAHQSAMKYINNELKAISETKQLRFQYEARLSELNEYLQQIYYAIGIYEDQHSIYDFSLIIAHFNLLQSREISLATQYQQLTHDIASKKGEITALNQELLHLQKENDNVLQIESSLQYSSINMLKQHIDDKEELQRGKDISKGESLFLKVYIQWLELC